MNQEKKKINLKKRVKSSKISHINCIGEYLINCITGLFYYRYKCNTCQAFIVGTRIHCNQCEDFDLCIGCHNKGSFPKE